MAMQKISLGVVFIIAVIGVIGTALAVLTASQTINNTAAIKTVGVGVYSNSQCTNKITSINWGTLSPGQQITRTIYVKNEGTVPIVLSMSVGNWTPSAASVISVTWNIEGTNLNAGASVSAVLTLSVPTTISGVTTFTFDITIKGTEQT